MTEMRDARALEAEILSFVQPCLKAIGCPARERVAVRALRKLMQSALMLQEWMSTVLHVPVMDYFGVHMSSKSRVSNVDEGA